MQPPDVLVRDRRAPRVEEQVHLDARLRALGERAREGAPRCVFAEDVRLEANGGARAGDGLEHRGEGLRAVLEQAQPMRADPHVAVRRRLRRLAPARDGVDRRLHLDGGGTARARHEDPRARGEGRRRGELGAIPPGFFGDVERGVGRLEERVGPRRARALEIGDADRHGDGRGGPAPLGPRAERFADALGELEGLRGRRLGQEHDKLVSAVTRRQIRGAARRAERLGDGEQRGVAGVVPGVVVDLLQVVDVDHQQREGRLVTNRAQELLGEARVDVAAVVEVRERIGDRRLGERVVAPAERASEQAEDEERRDRRIDKPHRIGRDRGREERRRRRAARDEAPQREQADGRAEGQQHAEHGPRSRPGPG